MRAAYRGGLLAMTLLVAGTIRVEAQREASPLPTWESDVWLQSGTAVPNFSDRSFHPRSHTGTGLLIGGLIGAAATTVFLLGFCGDADTKCEMDEVGRAVLFIAVPAAALGALIGSLVRTDDEGS